MGSRGAPPRPSSRRSGVESAEVPEPAPSTPAFEPLSLVGTTLDGRYELVAHLATGGMGAVFRARHVHLRKDVAVKVLRPDLTSSAEIVERFRREAEIASALEHDNIVRVTDFGRSPEGYLFLVMELLTGESLSDRLRPRGDEDPRLRHREDRGPVERQRDGVGDRGRDAGVPFAGAGDGRRG